MKKYFRKLKRIIKNTILILLFIISILILISECLELNIYIILYKTISFLYLYIFIKANIKTINNNNYIIYKQDQFKNKELLKNK